MAEKAQRTMGSRHLARLTRQRDRQKNGESTPPKKMGKKRRRIQRREEAEARQATYDATHPKKGSN